MKTQSLNLLIVDKNKMLVDRLSLYLKDKFGIKVNISSFFDAESCAVKVDEESHVLVLDYFINKEKTPDKEASRIFDSLKQKNPNVKVTMISSEEEAAKAMEEMKKETTNYIIKQENQPEKMLSLLNRMTLSPAYTMVVSPIKIRIILPIVKIISEYTLRDYLVMFIIAFAVVGSLVYLALKIF